LFDLSVFSDPERRSLFYNGIIKIRYIVKCVSLIRTYRFILSLRDARNLV
ncbi:hypothetical protein B0T14DRAFT_432394, partial [Immersiella caudata]